MPTRIGILARKWFAVAIIILIIALAGVGAYLKFYQPSSQTNSSLATSTTPQTSSTASTSGYNYLTTPQPLTGINIFKNSTPFGYPNGTIVYDKIGTTNLQQPIIVAYVSQAVGQGTIAQFNEFVIVQKSNQYTILLKNSTYLVSQNSVQQNVGSNVILDSTKTLPGTNVTNQLSVNGMSFKLASKINFIDGLKNIYGPSFAPTNTINPATDLTKIGQQGYDTVYQLTLKNGSGYSVISYYVTLGGVLADNLVPNNPIYAVQPTGSVNLPLPQISWNNGQSNSSAYSIMSIDGCIYSKSINIDIATGIADNQLIPVGKLANGQIVYELPTSNTAFLSAYTHYRSAYQASLNAAQGDTNVIPKNMFNLTPAEFQADHALIVVKNGLGQDVLYTRNDTQLPGMC